MECMTPQIEFGVGLLIGVLIALFATWALRLHGARERFSSADSGKTISVAQKIIDELAAFSVILDETAMPVYANTAARQYDGSTDLDRQLRTPEMQQIVFEVLATGEPFTKKPDNPHAADAVKLHIFQLDDYHVVVLADDLGEAQRVHAMRRDFIANMSHEFKTPIAAIGLLTEAIQKAAGDPETVQHFATKLGKESKRLGELSRDVIRLSEAQSSLAAEDREKIDLKALVQSEIEQHAEFALQHGVRFQLKDQTKKRQEAIILGRRSALGIAFSNLLTNAVMHSPSEEVVEITLTQHKDNFLVAVTDHGEGIEPQYLSRIFERFFRVDPARSREAGGTGLGLSIVRNTMRAHGGDVEVWSELGDGATFVLSFPLTLSAAMRRRKKSQKLKVDKARKSGQSTKDAEL